MIVPDLGAYWISDFTGSAPGIRILKHNPLKQRWSGQIAVEGILLFFERTFGSPITPMNVVCNLGVIPYENMAMSEHIERVCRNCYYQIRRIKKSISANSKTLLVLAFVHSRFDYCNSVLYSAFATLVAVADNAVCAEVCGQSDSKIEAFWTYITCLDWSALAALPAAYHI